MKFFKNKTDINEDCFIFMRQSRSLESSEKITLASGWYVRIRKQPHWKSVFTKSLRTADKDKALKKAQKIYEEIIQSENLVKKSLFDKEDRAIANRNAALGRIAEDKFKNFMMLKNYEVYIPVEDVWGNDCVLFKDGVTYRVQLKSSNSEMPTWQLQNNNKIKYKDTSTHMGFIYLPEGRIWFVPLSILPNVSCLRHPLMKTICQDYEVEI